MKIGIVSYGVGNVGSVRNMLWENALDACEVASPEALLACDRLILPGVGAFDAAMQRLHAAGLSVALDAAMAGGYIQILGLCLGAQLMFEASDEGGRAGLGWFPGRVEAFRPALMPLPLPVPHMGWAPLRPLREEPLLRGLEDDSRFYFAHSYHFAPADPRHVSATACYGYEFPAIVRRENVVGVQFHPEKSRRFGAALLRNFARP